MKRRNAGGSGAICTMKPVNRWSGSAAPGDAGTDAPSGLRPRLAKARMVTERAVEDLRRTIAALSPAVVERLGLAAALRQLVARFRKQHTAKVITDSGWFAGISMECRR